MELRNLITFSKIAEEKSFSKAAQALGYAQSTVTMQIKQLEKEIDVQLFERIGRIVYLTDKGKELLKYANNIIRLSEEAEFAMQDNEIPYGVIRIGVIESLCVSILPNIVEICKGKWPDVELVVKIATTPELVEMLNSNEVDMILTLDNKQENKNLITVIERPQEILFVSGPKFTFDKKELSLVDIIDKPFIMPEKVCHCRKLLKEKLSTFDHVKELNVFLEIGSSEIIKNFVKKSLVVSMLPELAIVEEVKDGSILVLDIVDFKMNLYIQLIHHKNKSMTPAIKCVLSVIKDQIELYL